MKTFAIATMLMTLACTTEPRRTIDTSVRCTQQDEDNGTCPGNGGGGSTPSDPPPDPLDVPRAHTEQAAKRAGYEPYSSDRAGCRMKLGGGMLCYYKVKLTAGAAGSFECDVVCNVDITGNEYCDIIDGSCHLN